jgi:hypothetical protein
MPNILPAVPHDRQRGRPQTVLWGGAPVLGVADKLSHTVRKTDSKPRRGRSGGCVYYMRKGRMCWRRQVVLEAPRTARRREKAKNKGPELIAQVSQSQSITRSTSGRPRTNTGLLPDQCQWEAGSTRAIGRTGSLECSPALGKMPRSFRSLEMRRGG